MKVQMRRGWFVVAGLFALSCAAPQKNPTRDPELGRIAYEAFENRLEAISLPVLLKKLDLTVRVYRDELDAADAEHIVGTVERFRSESLELCDAACRRPAKSDEEVESQSGGDGESVAAVHPCDAMVDCLEQGLVKFHSRVQAFKSGDLTAFTPPITELDACD